MKKITVPLADVCDVEYGTRVVQKRDGGKGFPVYGGGGATFEMDVFNRENRLVIARFGISEQCTRFVDGKFFLNDSGLTVSTKNGSMLQRFSDYQMLSLNDEIYALGKGTAQKNLDVPLFRALPLFVPSDLAEQQRIVGVLDEAFAGLAIAQAHAEKNLQNARALFESHLQSVFTQRGKRWVETTLGAEIDLLSGFPFKSARYTESEKDVRLLRGDNIIQGALRWDDVKRWPASDTAEYERYRLCAGDVVLAMDRPWVKAGLKRAQILPDDLPCLLVQRTARLRGNRSLENRFLVYLISSVEFTRHILGIQTGIGVPHISGQQIKDFQFFKPPVKEQTQIADKLNALSTETQRLESLYQQKQAALAALKKSLLHQAFAGNL